MILAAIGLLGLVMLAGVLIWLSQRGGGSSQEVAEAMRAAGCTYQTTEAEGREHIRDGTTVKYKTFPPTSGNHYAIPVVWNAYDAPVEPERVVHNLEHGGIVIWYQADQVTPEQIAVLEDFTRDWNGTERYKVLVAPWSGADFGHPMAILAWTWLLYLDEIDTDLMDTFLDQHYGDAPEPGGGPGPPAL